MGQDVYDVSSTCTKYSSNSALIAVVGNVAIFLSNTVKDGGACLAY